MNYIKNLKILIIYNFQLYLKYNNLKSYKKYNNLESYRKYKYLKKQFLF